jgi:diguanylate cyclase
MFKFLSRHSDTGSDTAHQPESAGRDGVLQAARRDLIEKIGDFLVSNDLDVTPANLALAHAAFAGADLDLAGKITERQIAGQPIDQRWLDEVRPQQHSAPEDPAVDEQQAAVDSMMTRLDSSIATFSAVTDRAQGATAAYGESLSAHVGQITAAGSDPVLASLIDIARAMIERTREIEQEMKRSSHEADALRKSLERARRDAEIDHLTGLPNRRAFEGVLETQYREAQQEIDLLTVAICDIDHFKLVNDNHGHETGDRVIQAIGQVLARISDDRCHVARHGGEEFVMLFRGRSVTEARDMLDQAREQLAGRRFINRMTDEPIGRITFSGGVANVFGWPDPREALRHADQALYAAKAAGRNQICVAGK